MPVSRSWRALLLVSAVSALLCLPAAAGATTHRYWVALEGTQQTDWWTKTGDACGFAVEQDGSQIVRVDVGFLATVASAPGVAMPWFEQLYVLPEQAADFPRMVLRTTGPVNISGTPCPGTPQSGACTGEPGPGCTGVPLGDDCYWQPLRHRRIAIAPTTRKVAATARRLAIGEQLPSVTAPGELSWQRCPYQPTDGTARAEIQNARGPDGDAATMRALRAGRKASVTIESHGLPGGDGPTTWLTSWRWKLTFVPCAPAWCVAPIPNPDPRALRNGDGAEQRLTRTKASRAVNATCIRSRVVMRRGRLSYYALDEHGPGALLGSARFRVADRATEVRVTVPLSAAAQARLRATGALAVRAVSRLDGAAPVSKSVVIRLPIPPTVVAGTGTAMSPYGTSAHVTGGIVAHATTVSYHFEYGPTTAYGSRTAEQSARSSGVQVGADLEDLQPATTYHFRLVATNAAGTTAGPDATFTTPSMPVGDPPEELLRR